MSLLIKSLTYASLLFLGSLSGSDFKLETVVEKINRFPIKNAVSVNFKFVVSDSGEVTWAEQNPTYVHLFYWSKETGTIEINIDEALSRSGINRLDAATSIWPYPTHLDHFGNVYINIDCRLASSLLLPSGRNCETKIGVWNKKFGFKLLNIPDIAHVVRFQVSDDMIFVYGEDSSGEEKFVMLRPIDGHWPWEDRKSEIVEAPVKQAPETTPWDNLPFGKHSDRLHILQQLLKSTKSSDEKKTIMIMLYAEIGHVLDVLQYDVKRAQALLDKAYSESKKNPEAEKERADAQKHLTALERYLKSLSKADQCKVANIDLPSKTWIATP